HMWVIGRAPGGKAAGGSFASLSRRWQKGDIIELDLPFSFRAVPIEESARNPVAVMRGPVMLPAIDPPEQLTASAAALSGMQSVSGAPLEFDCRTAAGSVRMRPFYKVQRETYSTYFQRTEA